MADLNILNLNRAKQWLGFEAEARTANQVLNRLEILHKEDAAQNPGKTIFQKVKEFGSDLYNHPLATIRSTFKSMFAKTVATAVLCVVTYVALQAYLQRIVMTWLAMLVAIRIVNAALPEEQQINAAQRTIDLATTARNIAVKGAEVTAPLVFNATEGVAGMIFDAGVGTAAKVGSVVGAGAYSVARSAAATARKNAGEAAIYVQESVDEATTFIQECASDAASGLRSRVNDAIESARVTARVSRFSPFRSN